MSSYPIQRQDSRGNGSNLKADIPKPSFYEGNGQPSSGTSTNSFNTTNTDGQSHRPGTSSTRGNAKNNGNSTNDASSNFPVKSNLTAEQDVFDLTNQTIKFDGLNGVIRKKIFCKNEEFYAIESDKPMPGCNGICPRCDGYHVRFNDQRHGYYALVADIHQKFYGDHDNDERARGPKSVDNLKTGQENVPPLSEPVIGKNKGIEGDANSCYMDSTIFCMFAYTGVFDTLLNKKITEKNVADLQTLLRKNIVNVLRTSKGFVERDALYHLRCQLSEATGDKSFREDEKDPTEFLRALERLFDFAPLKTILPNQQPRKDQSNITANIMWEMFDPNIRNQPSTNIGSIFRNSLTEIPAKLATVPPFLILIAPRHSRTERSYRYIIPDHKIVLDHHMVQLICEECKQTYSQLDDGNDFYHCYNCSPTSLSSSTEATVVSRCYGCTEKNHDKEDIDRKHQLRQVKNIATLNLFAVLCIERCHYVAFVKCEKQSNQHEWLFFDSMSDRVGDVKNVPSVTSVPQFEDWIRNAETDEKYFEKIDKLRSSGKPLAKAFEGDEMKRLRLFRDGAFFFYENPAASYQ